MAERSILWDTNGVGDGLVGGYTEADLDLVDRMLWLNDPTTQGVSLDYLNSLEITNPAGVNLSMDTGGAVVYGHPYWNTAAVVIPLVLPVINTTGWRWVLRASWAAQTVRAVLLQSADGVIAIPALTQVAGVTWEISLAQGTITVGGAIAITDDRAYLEPGILIDNEHMENRTMRVLVQAVECETVGAHVDRAFAQGWPCATGVDTNAYGNFRMPEDADLTQAFNITPVFTVSATTATNIRIWNAAQFGNIGEAWSTHLTQAQVTVASGAATLLQAPGAATIDIQPLADNNDFISLFWERTGIHVADTFAGDVYFMGWLLEYTRDH